MSWEEWGEGSKTKGRKTLWDLRRLARGPLQGGWQACCVPAHVGPGCPWSPCTQSPSAKVAACVTHSTASCKQVPCVQELLDLVLWVWLARGPACGGLHTEGATDRHIGWPHVLRLDGHGVCSVLCDRAVWPYCVTRRCPGSHPSVWILPS